MTVAEPSVEVEQFARVFVDDPGQLPPQADCFKSDRGYFYRLNLQSVDANASAALVQKAKRQFDVELVGQVREDGDIVKERRYVESIADVPDGYTAERGPEGGIYYETNPVNDPTDSVDPAAGDAAATVGYEGEPVLAVQFEDIEEGDRIAFERPGSGERDMGEVTAIDMEAHEVEVESGDGFTTVAAAPIETAEQKSDGTVTSSTPGVQSARYSGDDDDEEDDELGRGGEVSKVGEIHRELDNGMIECQASEGRYDPEVDVGPDGVCPGCDEPISYLQKDADWSTADEEMGQGHEADEGVWTYYYGPKGGEGWLNMQTGEIRYQKQRPGQAPENGDGYGDWLEDGWDAPPEDVSELAEGQTVEFYDNGDEEYREGEVDILDPEGAYAYIDGDVNGIVGPEGDDELTAVEADYDGDGEAADPSDEAVDIEDYDWGDEGWENTAAVTDWEPISHVSDETVEEGQTGVLVMDYPHDEGKTGFIGTLHPEEDGEWKIDVKNHDEKNFNFATPVNENGVEAYVESTEGTDGDMEDALLAEAGLDTGDWVEFKLGDDVMTGQVVGTTSLMEDGDPSHIEVKPEGADTTITQHPNGLHEVAPPEEAEAEADPTATDPAEDAVGEPVDDFDLDDETEQAIAEEAEELLDEIEDGPETAYHPDAVEEWRDMSDIGANHGNSVAAMEVGVLSDGSKYVHKDVDHHSVSEDDIHRETVGYEFGKHFDDNLPEHVADLDAGWAASAVAPGVDAKDATPEMQEAVDREDFLEMAAVQLILGNTDAHQNNVRVTEEGDLHAFDLDRCGGDITADWVGKLTQYEDSVDRATGELIKTADALGLTEDEVDQHAIVQAATEFAQSLSDETIAEARNDAVEHDAALAANIRNNINAFRDGEVSL